MDVSGSVINIFLLVNLNGFRIEYKPYGTIKQWLKKAEQKWKVAWQQSMPEEVERLVGNATGDVAAVWTRAGRLLRLSGAGDGESPSLSLVAYKHRFLASKYKPNSIHSSVEFKINFMVMTFSEISRGFN